MGENRLTDYQLIRSNRKTISLQITEAGEVLVRAPRRCPRSYIDSFVQSKERWIMQHRAQVQASLETRQEFRLKPGDSLGFCGEEYRVQLTKERRCSLDLEQKVITLPDTPVQDIRQIVERLYRRGGLPWVEERLRYWAGKMGVTYGKVNLSSAVRRWASCSANGNIHVSWLLLFAPMEAIDYVLVHELCHRVEFNHSPAFWRLVAQYQPDYPAQKQVLRQLHQRLYAQGWIQK